mmetsp:Transcript_15354/g.20245  ORF Transcript_15354/g.20245 Transcript_15354/m.20245 type:complete len:294 (-) Transcript_15354:21-902(-)
MVSTVSKSGLQSKNRVSSNNTGSQNGFDTLLNTRNIFLRNVTSLNIRSEFEIHGTLFFGEFLRLEGKLNTSILSRTTRLLLVGVVNLSNSCDGLTVRHLGCTNIGLNVELTLHAVNNNFQVKLSHTFNDGLTSFFVTTETEGWILGSKTDKGLRHFLLIGLGLGFDGNLNDGFREFHLLKDDSIVLATESFSGGSILKTNQSNDISSDSRLNFGTVVGMHLKHTSNTFILFLDRVVDSGSGFHNSGVNTGESKSSDERIVGNLEGQSRKRLGIRRVTDSIFSIIGDTSNSLNV